MKMNNNKFKIERHIDNLQDLIKENQNTNSENYNIYDLQYYYLLE